MKEPEFSLQIIIVILSFHYIADWILQSRHIAVNKSKNFSILFLHCFLYSIVMSLTCLRIAENPTLTNLFGFWCITFSSHLLIDYISSKLNAINYIKRNDIFWKTIGFDQLLHYTFLFVSYKIFFL